MILIVDNYDSFVHNLARYVRLITSEPIHVVRNDELNPSALNRQELSAVIISPGPCGPKQAGVGIELVNLLYRFTPILGVCLGHQIIVEALGGTIHQAPQPMHGKQSSIQITAESRLFSAMPSRFAVGRYHSLVARADDLPGDLRVTAKSDDGLIMAVEHVAHPVFGVQFHPESILTEHGEQLLSNFLTAITEDASISQSGDCSDT